MEAARHGRPRLLGEILVEHDLLTEEELEHVLALQRNSGRPLGEIAVSLGLLSSPALAAVLAEQVGVPLETERGFGSGLWVEIGRRHKRGPGIGYPAPVERWLGALAPAAADHAQPPRLELVDPAPEPTVDERSSEVAALLAEIAARETAHEIVVRELDATRIALGLAEQALEREARAPAAPEEASGATIVVQVSLDRGLVRLLPGGGLARSITGALGETGPEPVDSFLAQTAVTPRRIAEAPPQDPVFGLYHENLAGRLTRSNWRTKAILRALPDGRLLYVWATPVDDGYCVRVRPDRSLEAVFRRLADALAFANGETGRLGDESRPVDRDGWPSEHDVLVLCCPVVACTD